MEQVKYILYSLLILMGGFMTYTVMKPMVQSQWVKIETREPGFCGTEDDQKPVVKNIAGKNLFSTNCQTCHAIQKILTGPALAGVEERGPWTKREYLVKWVNNPAAFMAKNPYAKELAAKYNGQIMPSFSQLSEQEIAEIFDYIKEASPRPSQIVR